MDKKLFDYLITVFGRGKNGTAIVVTRLGLMYSYRGIVMPNGASRLPDIRDVFCNSILNIIGYKNTIFTRRVLENMCVQQACYGILLYLLIATQLM